MREQCAGQEACQSGFLRGCGFSDEFIRGIPKLLKSSPYQSCFISYSTAVQEFATRLNKSLQRTGVRCWFAPHDMRGGQKIHEQINSAIRIYDKLLLNPFPRTAWQADG